MTGRAEVARLKQRLDATFERLKGSSVDIEVQSDFARYLCILVSGYIEKAVYELVVEHARRTGAPSLQRFVDQRTKSFTNAKSQKLISLLGDFDPEWRARLEAFMAGELKDAVDALVALRNNIAHGQSVGVTFARVADYYGRAQSVIDYIADLCAPV